MTVIFPLKGQKISVQFTWTLFWGSRYSSEKVAWWILNPSCKGLRIMRVTSFGFLVIPGQAHCFKDRLAITYHMHQLPLPDPSFPYKGLPWSQPQQTFPAAWCQRCRVQPICWLNLRQAHIIFTSFWPRWVFVAVCSLLSLVSRGSRAHGLRSSCSTQA